jgi:transposase
MVQNNRDFTAKEWQYLFLKGNSAKKIYDDTLVTLGEKRPSYSTVKNWVTRFRAGHFSTEDEECFGRPTQVTGPVNMDAIQPMILDNQRISAKEIVETLAISPEKVGYIIHKILDMRKLSAKWVPKCLNVHQKHVRVLASQDILDRFWWDPVLFLNRLITVDETWIHIYDPETKEQSKEWRHRGSSRQKKLKHRSNQARCWCLSSGTKMEFCL